MHGDRCNSICVGNRSVHMELNMARQHLVCRAEIVGLFQSLRVSKTTRLKIIRNTLTNKIRAGIYCQSKVRSL